MDFKRLLPRIHPKTRFFTAQRVPVRASLEQTFAGLTAFGGGPKGPGQSYSEILEQDGNRSLVRFTTFSRGKRIVTKEEVTVYPPNLITYRHIEGPLAYVYEVFTVLPASSGQMVVNYMGEYRMKTNDYPVLGWLIHRFVVLPEYDAIIAKHLTQARDHAEQRKVQRG